MFKFDTREIWTLIAQVWLLGVAVGIVIGYAL